MATIEEWANDLSGDIQRFVSTGANKVLLRMGQQAFADSKVRIFTDGIKSNGSPIGTYAASTIKQKEREGRFTSSRINLRDTENLVNSYAVEPEGNNRVVLGFIEVRRPDGITNAELVDITEKNYGSIYTLTDKEIERTDQILENVEIFD